MFGERSYRILDPTELRLPHLGSQFSLDARRRRGDQVIEVTYVPVPVGQELIRPIAPGMTRPVLGTGTHLGSMRTTDAEHDVRHCTPGGQHRVCQSGLQQPPSHCPQPETRGRRVSLSGGRHFDQTRYLPNLSGPRPHLPVIWNDDYRLQTTNSIRNHRGGAALTPWHADAHRTRWGTPPTAADPVTVAGLDPETRSGRPRCGVPLIGRPRPPDARSRPPPAN